MTQPRPPFGYSSLPISSTQILLPLTISNKCGQSFRWRGVEVYEEVQEDMMQIKNEADFEVKVKKEQDDAPTTMSHTLTTSTFKKTTEWSICLSDRVVFVRQDEERGFVYYKTMLGEGQHQQSEVDVAKSTAVWLQDYLNLAVPLAELYEEWSDKDEVFRRFAKRFTGVRMLRQDPWECLCAFICSSNNNIARIGQMVQNLCTHFSEPLLTYTYPAPPREVLQGEDEVQVAPTIITYHPFPSAARLAQGDIEDRLRALSFGYRARYISETANMLMAKLSPGDEDAVKYESVDQYLYSLRRMTYTEARTELLQFPGIGPKVADCILLMSMDQPASIPVDRHVFQFAERWYRIKTKGGLKGYELIADKFRSLWGPYAGWAHSVLFTADLRAFATYKKEPEIKVELEEYKMETSDENGQSVTEERIEVKEEPVFYDSGRPARKETLTTSIGKRFRGIKHTTSSSSISRRKQTHQ